MLGGAAARRRAAARTHRRGDAGGAGARPAFIRPGSPDRYRGLQLGRNTSRVSQCSSGPHKPRQSGATPEPATSQLTEYANRQSDQVESLVILWVRLPPQSLRSRGPTARRQPDLLATMVQFHPGSMGGSVVRGSLSVVKRETGLSPLTTDYGPMTTPEGSRIRLAGPRC